MPTTIQDLESLLTYHGLTIVTDLYNNYGLMSANKIIIGEGFDNLQDMYTYLKTLIAENTAA